MEFGIGDKLRWLNDGSWMHDENGVYTIVDTSVMGYIVTTRQDTTAMYTYDELVENFVVVE